MRVYGSDLAFLCCVLGFLDGRQRDWQAGTIVCACMDLGWIYLFIDS
jgi:hypothetical protein